MFNRRIALAALALTLVTVFAAPSMYARASLTNVNRVTFNRPVALPGVILLPGSYAFEAGALGMNPNIVRVTSPDYQKLYFVGFTGTFLVLSGMHSLPTFYAATMLLALGNAGIGDVSVGAVITRWFERSRGMALGFALAGSNIGAVVFVPAALRQPDGTLQAQRIMVGRDIAPPQ